MNLNEPSDPVIRCLALHGADLMVGLGDGRVLHFDYDAHSHTLHKDKTFQIGTRMPRVNTFFECRLISFLGTTQARCVSIDIDDGSNFSYFFVCSDRPSLIVNDKFGLR